MGQHGALPYQAFKINHSKIFCLFATKVKRRNTELSDRVTTKGGVFGTNFASRDDTTNAPPTLKKLRVSE
jgi:hypothetical protein